MLVSLQADYALRVLVDVAKHQARSKAVVTREIADRQRVPRVFLTKIVAQLASHGMLRTQRGKGGGVTLGKVPEQIVLLDVIEAFEGSLQFNQCAHDTNCCTLSQGCNIRAFWRSAEVYLKDFFRQRTLNDLMQAVEDRVLLEETLPGSFHQPEEFRSISVGTN
jgi:Rrf2 family protein